VVVGMLRDGVQVRLCLWYNEAITGLAMGRRYRTDIALSACQALYKIKSRARGCIINHGLMRYLLVVRHLDTMSKNIWLMTSEPEGPLM